MKQEKPVPVSKDVRKRRRYFSGIQGEDCSYTWKIWEIWELAPASAGLPSWSNPCVRSFSSLPQDELTFHKQVHFENVSQRGQIG